MEGEPSSLKFPRLTALLLACRRVAGRSVASYTTLRVTHERSQHVNNISRQRIWRARRRRRKQGGSSSPQAYGVTFSHLYHVHRKHNIFDGEEAARPASTTLTRTSPTRRDDDDNDDNDDDKFEIRKGAIEMRCGGDFNSSSRGSCTLPTKLFIESGRLSSPAALLYLARVEDDHRQAHKQARIPFPFSEAKQVEVGRHMLSDDALNVYVMTAAVDRMRRDVTQYTRRRQSIKQTPSRASQYKHAR